MDKFLYFLLGGVFAFCAYILVIWMPFSIVHEAKCLDAGYPAVSTDFFLNGYCISRKSDGKAEVIPLEGLK